MTNKQVVEKFYEAFSRKDAATMNSCYADDIVFSDPVFGMLQGNEVRHMWEMLCSGSRNFSLEFNNITEIDEEYITCNWTATYEFSATGRKVVNKVKAFMRINNGSITEHSDAFRLSTWMTQAFGLKGYLFGWTNFMKRAVQKRARKNLDKFMNDKEIP